MREDGWMRRGRGRSLKAVTARAVLVVTATTALAFAAGCGGGGAETTSSSARLKVVGEEGSTGSSSSASTSESGPSTAVVVKGCPDPGAMGQAIGFPVKKTSLGENGCAYFPLGEETPGISVQVLHPQKAFPDLTTLAEAKKHDRFGGGTAESESADVGGGHITSYLEDTPQYGPETFRAGESIEGKSEAESFVTCDYFVLGTDGYPASVQAIAQRGGTYSYEGATKSKDEVCEWATAALELTIE